MAKPAEQPPSDMEVDAALEEKPPVRFSNNVLELMREAQMQHGLRQSDYTRYRRYCSARLRRLYKPLKFLHGRGRYTRRNITESTVTDVREAGAYNMSSTTTNPDASSPSFSEALKSNKKPPSQYDASESADGGPGGKGAKKKTKKGKQIDPSLLGFKVHSNRIMMGEIVRDD